MKRIYKNKKTLYKYFVDFFGQEHALTIKERMKNMILLDYDNQDQTIQRLLKLKISKTNKMNIFRTYQYAKTQNTIAGGKLSVIENDKLLHICFISLKHPVADHILVHEIMHAVSTKFEGYAPILGGSYLTGFSRKYFKDLGKEDLPNEIITDYLSYQISLKMKKDNVIIVSNQEMNEGYSKAFVLFAPLYKLCENEFKNGYITNDSTQLLKKIGAINLNNVYNNIESLIALYKSCYKTFNLQNIIMEYQNQFDNPIKIEDFIDLIIKYDLQPKVYKTYVDQKTSMLIWDTAKTIKDCYVKLGVLQDNKTRNKIQNNDSRLEM